MTFIEMQTKYRALEDAISRVYLFKKANNIRVSEDDAPHNVFIDDISIHHPSIDINSDGSISSEMTIIMSTAIDQIIELWEARVVQLKEELGIEE